MEINPVILGGFPASGPLRGTAGQCSFADILTDSGLPRGRPFGAAQVVAKAGLPFLKITELNYFHGNASHYFPHRSFCGYGTVMPLPPPLLHLLE